MRTVKEEIVNINSLTEAISSDIVEARNAMEKELLETSNYQVFTLQRPLEAGGLNRVLEVEMTGIELERSFQLS